MIEIDKHIIRADAPITGALKRFNVLAEDAILFVVDDEDRLQGSLTDGDFRRGILNGKKADSAVIEFCQGSPHFLNQGNYSLSDIINLRQEQLGIVPVLNANHQIVDLINFRVQRSALPVEVIVMAGGLGSRLKPLTDNTPKPLLKIGDKVIIDYSIDRLIDYGVKDFWVSIRYLGDQIVDHFSQKDCDAHFNYIWEDSPLGTIGAASKITNLNEDYVLITNSDVLTNIDYEDFFLDFIQKEADMSVVTIPYHVSIPYAVLETESDNVISFKEKPKYTYYSNAGIYLIKKNLLNFIPKNTFYNSTDLMEEVIKQGLKLISYSNNGYWLDIGKPQDFEKAQQDIKHIHF